MTVIKLPDPDQWDPDPDAVAIMKHIDRMAPWMRELVREYGYAIIRAILDESDGELDPFNLADQLQTWRERRQEQWLATDYVTSRSMHSIADAIQYKMSDRQL